MEIKEPYGFIYITTNMINGKRYIGQKKFCKWWQSYLGSGTAFRNAVKKYGKENFVRDIVDIAYSKEELDELEIEYIKNYNANKSKNFYNITKGGDGASLNGELNGMYGKHHTKEQKIYMSEALKGEKNYFYGKHHTEETKKKISEFNKGKWVGEKSCLSKKVICLDTKEIFGAISDIKRKYGYSASSIAACCRKETKTAYNKVWMFLEDYNKMNKKEVMTIYEINKKGVTGEYNPKAKEVICLNTSEIFKTLKEAGEKYSVSGSSISYCCSKIYKSVASKEYGKIVFRYYEDYLKMTEQDIKDDIFYGKYNCEAKDKIICLETNKIYYCARQIEEETGLFATSITACCKGKYKTVGKLHWKYCKDLLTLTNSMEGGEKFENRMHTEK